MSGYRTIVADPPWPMPASNPTTRGAKDTNTGYLASGSGRAVSGDWWGKSRGSRSVLPYQSMTPEQIEALPVAELAAKDAHLYLWTTNRFLERAFGIARAWGFKPSQLLTWCKPPMGVGFGGSFTSTTEFVLFARRGSLAHLAREDSTWWRWSRVYENGKIAHSAKPEAFLDMVERVSPAPHLELFARRNRLGWDTWGNEALNHVSLDGEAA